MKKTVAQFRFGSIDSTNNWAKANIHLLDPEKITLVSAERQTAGRGRFKREWISPNQQNIYATFCFFVSPEASPQFNISQVMSISASKTLEDNEFKPHLKWPNDILLSNKKVGGILSETVSGEEKICILVGIGLNINMPQELANQIGQPATSLLIEGGKKWDIGGMIDQLADHFSRDLDIFLKEGFAPLFPEYTCRLGHVRDKPIKVKENDYLWEGQYHSINQDGSLNLLLVDGTLKRLYSGETN